ncbi:MAG: sigma-54 dependent transcriptional regulator [bacterium]
MTNLKPTILVVDDDVSILDSFETLLKDDYEVSVTTTGEEALKITNDKKINLVLLDLILPDIDGMEILQQIKKIDLEIEVIIITGMETSVESSIRAMQLGAYDYITKPLNINELSIIIKRALEKQRLRREVTYLRTIEAEKPISFANIIGKSPMMQQVYEIMEVMSKNDNTVLITGESGTGKELVARAIHFNGLRTNYPFILVNCATIPDNLVESELFGYEKETSIDPDNLKRGKFELAQGGTLFLDEVASLKLEVQAKILRVLESKEIEKIGGRKPVKIDVRIIASTNTDLKKAVKQATFREDLYFRLNVIPIHLPPLRERKEDIPLLIQHFLKEYNQRFNKNIKGVTPQALETLKEYYWPGNVRELQNILERLVVLAGDEDYISPKHLPMEFFIHKGTIKTQGLTLKEARDKFEKEFISAILEKVGWNQTKAAQLLDVHRNTILLKIKELNIKPPFKMEEEK